MEVREGNTETAALIRAIYHAPTHAAVDDTAGPAFLNLAGRVINRQGTKHLRADMTGPLDRSWELGERLAELLIGQGAESLLADET